MTERSDNPGDPPPIEGVSVSLGAAMPAVPSIEQARAGRMSPLQLALLSLVCDPLFIPGILAIIRGTAELREVRDREGTGTYSDEHARVRTGAIWAMVIVLGRFVPLVAICLILGVAVALDDPRDEVALSPFGGESEVAEIMERLRSEDAATRAMAARHLLECVPYPCEAIDTEEVLAIAADPGLAAASGAPHVPSLLVRALAQQTAPLPAAALADLQALYPSLEPRARSATLRVFVRDAPLGDAADAPAWLTPAWLTLARAETAPHPELRLPIEELAALAPADLEPIFELEASPAFAADVMRVVGASCDAYGGSEIAARLRPRAEQRWSALRAQLAVAPATPGLPGLLGAERQAQATEAVGALAVLTCSPEHDLASAREALASADPRVALAGVEHLWARGVPVPDQVIARLASEPLVLAPLADALFPREVGDAGALERSRLVRHIAEHEGFAATVLSVRDHWPRPDEHLRVYDVGGVAADGSRVEATAIAASWSSRADDFQAVVLLGPYDADAVERSIESLEDGGA